MHKFRSFDSVRVFNIVAQAQSVTEAAEKLSLSKGAVSHQIKRLEQELGFKVFERSHGRISLTSKGTRLWDASRPAYKSIEQEISNLQRESDAIITIGMTTYFASRWLSPRLMNFTSVNEKIGLRLQPTVGLIDPGTEQIDMAIRWGSGHWTDMEIEPLFNCPAFPTSGSDIARLVDQSGFKKIVDNLQLLHDFEDSTAWQDWFDKSQLPLQPRSGDLVIPDPNVRVQAVIDGQGIALNDRLVEDELSRGVLHQISEVELEDYGYFLAYPRSALDNPALRLFRDWILSEASE